MAPKAKGKAAPEPPPEPPKEEVVEEPVVPEEPPEPVYVPLPEPPLYKKVTLKELLPLREGINKFPESAAAEKAYRQAIEDCVRVIAGSCAQAGADKALAIELLQRGGYYSDLKTELRDTMVRICRERLQKDLRFVPGKPLGGELKVDFVSGTYTYLRTAAEDVLQELRTGGEASAPSPVLDESTLGKRAAPEGKEVRAHSPVAAALAESAVTRRARGAVMVASEPGDRFARLAWEAELAGNWDRAAKLHQSRLLLDPYRGDANEWVTYAKFCGRRRGRQAAAEEALRQAVQILAAVPHEESLAEEVDLMLACLLLDRGRYQDAITVFAAWHQKDFANPFYRLLLGLALFLQSDQKASSYLESAGHRREWFQDLQDEADVVHKLRQEPPDPILADVYAAGLGRLLDFGLPSLVFTFLDQCCPLGIGKDEEALVLIGTKASALDRDFQTAVARLEPLLVEGKVATLEAWKLAADSYLQLRDFDKALQAMQKSMTDVETDDPTVYLALGLINLAKKRWRQARETFLKSIQYKATAEAWTGVAHAEYRSDDLQMCYEALCEANLLDNERADVWAQLTLVHLKMENVVSAENCWKNCRLHLESSPDCGEWVKEVTEAFTSRGLNPDDI